MKLHFALADESPKGTRRKAADAFFRERGARARLRTSDYERYGSWHEPIGRSREHAPRESSVHRPRPDNSAPEELSEESANAQIARV